MRTLTLLGTSALLASASACSSPPGDEGEGTTESITKPPRSQCDAIDAHWAKNAWLGAPLADEAIDPADNAHYRRYAQGTILRVPQTGCAWAMGSAIWSRWESQSWRWTIGYPVLDVVLTNATHQWQRFDSGAFYASPAGTFVLMGALENAQIGLSAPAFPIADETATRGGLAAPLEDGTWLAWTDIAGAHRVSGHFATLWTSVGQAYGYMGFPIDDETCLAGTCTQDFQWTTLRETPTSLGRVSPPSQRDAVVRPTDTQDGFVPNGACDADIATHYAKNKAVLGLEADTGDHAVAGGGAYHKYEHGVVVLNPRVHCAFFLVNGFRDVSGFAPGVVNPQAATDLGYPVSDELWNDAGRAHQYFDRGSLFWTATLGIRKLGGTFAVRHAEQRLSLGYPSTDQGPLPDDARWSVSFENDAMFVGSSEMHSGILDAWRLHGAAIGYPAPFDAMSCTESGVCWKSFDHGIVRWHSPESDLVIDGRPYFEQTPGPYFDSVAVGSLRPTATSGGTLYSMTFGAALPQGSSHVPFLVLGFTLPSDQGLAPVRFVKRGWGADACNVPDATITFQPGQASTPDDLLALFGSYYPRPGATFAACPPAGAPLNIPVTVYDRIAQGG